MIKVKIGAAECEAEGPAELDQTWLYQHLAHESSSGPACVMVSITTGSINMALASGSCPPGRGGRRPTEDEERIFDLWERCGLKDQIVRSAQIHGFLQQLRHMV